MDLALNEAQALVRDTARSFARAEVAPGARERDLSGTFPESLLRELGRLGLLGVNVSLDLGGSGAGAVAYALAMMEISAACASTSVAMAVTNMCAELIDRFGTEEQRRRFVPQLVSGDAVAGAFALSEPHCGSDAAALKTRAMRRGEEWILDGEKQWITSGAQAGVTVVWARTHPTERPGRALSCFIVEAGTAGMTAGRPEHKMGLRASHTVPLTFEGCAVPAAQLLGGEGGGFKLAMAALDGGRIGIASQACGVARAALEASVRYAKDRRAFGQPIGQFQAIAWFLADMRTQLAAAELLTLRAAHGKERGGPFTREASMAKLFASEMANRACDRAVQIHGGYGYLNEFPVERYFRDARVQTLYEGTSEIQRLVIARELLREGVAGR